NNELLNINYTIAFNGDSGTWEETMGFGHLDGVANNNWAFLSDPAGVAQSSCVNGVRSAPTPTFAGTGMTAQTVGNTLTLSVPYTFNWSDNQAVPHSYQLMAAGDTLTSISSQALSDADAATTPPIAIPPGCTGSG